MNGEALLSSTFAFPLLNQRLTQDFKYNTGDLMACFALVCDSKMSCVLNDWDQKIKGTLEKTGSGPQMFVHCQPLLGWLL